MKMKMKFSKVKLKQNVNYPFNCIDMNVNGIISQWNSQVPYNHKFTRIEWPDINVEVIELKSIISIIPIREVRTKEHQISTSENNK